MLELQAHEAAAYPVEEVCHSIVAPAWHAMVSPNEQKAFKGVQMVEK